MKNAEHKNRSTAQIAARFHELAQQEKWMEIQEEFFSEDIRSIDPPGSPYFGYAEGRLPVRKKGEEFMKRLEAVHSASTTAPIVAANYFVVGRKLDLSIKEMGRVELDQLMMYEVKEGYIVLEQFFY